jgi:GTP 3',8-cyclase
VKLTGGEPCTRSDLPAIVHAFRQAGFADVSLISNGSLLSPQLQRELKSAGLHRLTVSLHTLHPDRYQQLMRLSSRTSCRTPEA